VPSFGAFEEEGDLHELSQSWDPTFRFADNTKINLFDWSAIHLGECIGLERLLRESRRERRTCCENSSVTEIEFCSCDDVLKHPVSVSAAELAHFSKLYRNDARPTHPLYGRTVFGKRVNLGDAVP
jgi:hypothetical protein